MKFLDQAKIYVKSGDGGPGCISFRREKYVERGGPDGGNGGRGGDIIFRAVRDLNTLIDFRYTQHFRAKSGEGGQGRDKSGAKGDSIIIKVPVGTEIIDEDKETVLIDMTREGQEVFFLKGGDGGFGNAHYKNSVNQAPRKKTPGWPGEERALWLRLKLIADAGLVGMPNAGKSTFLAACSKAKPKIADYPFTTLHPNLGVVKAGNYDFVLADIPGLIEGAHEGHGLGDRFLGHVERTAVLLHLVDITQDNPAQNYKIIRHELEQYAQHLAQKNEIVALTKSDAMTDDEVQERRQIFAKETGIEPLVISAVSGAQMDNILYKLADIIKTHKQQEYEKDNPNIEDDTYTNKNHDLSYEDIFDA